MEKIYQSIGYVDTIIFTYIGNYYMDYVTKIKAISVIHKSIFINPNGNKTYSFYGTFESTIRRSSEKIFGNLRKFTVLHVNCGFKNNTKNKIEFIDSVYKYDHTVNQYFDYLNNTFEGKWDKQRDYNYDIVVNYNKEYIIKILQYLQINNDIIGVIMNNLD